MRKKSGFTLIELLVAMAAASVLSVSALQVYGRFHRFSATLTRSYQTETADLLRNIRCAVPYSVSPDCRPEAGPTPRRGPIPR
ncbi:MAG: prepilin-type N-terminal cleavage/methylation domain-containing protein [Fibrobacter sp.]|nr:prepilin-type N-terminal cleavage/methylation domain-containing protein [Fibrobacter sp.]